jgi:hypothetical protein
MSAGAVFKLVANDGKSDRMIMATALLNQRIKDVMCARATAGKLDPTPTLVDIEKTHILFVNAHFKPYAAIGFEYNKVRASGGNPTLGGSVVFSIPQFGDFFCDMVLRTRLSSFSGKPLTFAQPATIDSTYNATNAFGHVIASGASQLNIVYNNLVRYCEFPANRLISSVKFDVNGNHLDQYSSNVSVMLEKFTVPVGKRDGYNRLTGQQVPREGTSPPQAYVVTDTDALSTPAGISNNVSGQSNRTANVYNNLGPGTCWNSLDEYSYATNTTSTLNSDYAIAINYQYTVMQQQYFMLDGPQTPKLVQPALELWHKLKFWFCDDVRLAIPSVSIPFGQRFIKIDLAHQHQLAYEYPNLQVTKFIGSTSRGTFTQVGVAGTTPILIEEIELYINNIFVNPEIHDIYIKRIGFSLIRVYREQVSQQNTNSSGTELLSNLKWPVEYMYVGFRPVWNTTDPEIVAPHPAPNYLNPTLYASEGNLNSWRDWHRMTRQIDVNGTGYNYTTYNPRTWLPVSTIDSLSLHAHGITIFDSFQDIFYSEYLPYNYGSAAINTPTDSGAFFVNMALFPRSYQPSGHLNVSRARETYLSWTTSYISSKTPTNLIVVAVAINFLLVSDGSAVLRYST